jgi:ankyrin repeat protein
MSSTSDLHSLVKAIKRGDVERIESLVKSGVDLNRQDDYGHTPLCHAASRGNPKVVQALLDCGADVNLADHIGFTPLTCAVRDKQKKAAEVLRQAGGKHEDTNLLIESIKETYPDLDTSWFVETGLKQEN